MKKTILFAVMAIAAAAYTPAVAQTNRMLAMNAPEVTKEPPRYVIDNALMEEELDLANELWWTNQRGNYLKRLGSKSTLERGEAIRGIIWFTTHHNDRVKFDRANNTLFEIFLFDRDDQVRLMAVAAIAQLGDENTLNNLAYYQNRIMSPRVEKAVAAALRAR